MKIALFVVGKTSFPYIQQGIEDYSKRLSRWIDFEIFTIKDSKLQYAELIKKQEAEYLHSKIQEQDYVILLDERGKKHNSLQFSEQLSRWQENNKKIIFIIGGAYGFDKSIYARANESISFSEMTFSHQVIRLMYMEQLYRAFTIKHRLPYHHE
jgi:23S rRNA (pseudouridine1915-N3)-methyltransferase